MPLPTKAECWYVWSMLQSELINPPQVTRWADELVLALDRVPAWLGDLSAARDQNGALAALEAYVSAPPFEPIPTQLDDFQLGCLWLRHESGELSWADFLERAGLHLDGSMASWECETPYFFLDRHRSAGFSEASEEETKREFLEECELGPWAELAASKRAPFRELD